MDDMSDDIVERLRDADAMTKTEVADVLSDAADEIERLRMLGDRLVNAVYFLLDGAEPTEDLAGVLAVWEGANHD